MKSVFLFLMLVRYASGQNECHTVNTSLNFGVVEHLWYGHNESECWEAACTGRGSVLFDVFDLEKGYDFLSVNNRTYSGNRLPRHRSFQKKLRLDFSSDKGVKRKGFRSTVTCELPFYVPTPVLRSDGCLQLDLTGNHALVDHFWHSNNEAKCWKASCPSGNGHVLFDVFDTDKEHDWLTVNEKSYSGSTIPLRRSFSNLNLRFTSDLNTKHRGFRAVATCEPSPLSNEALESEVKVKLTFSVDGTAQQVIVMLPELEMTLKQLLDAEVSVIQFCMGGQCYSRGGELVQRSRGHLLAQEAVFEFGVLSDAPLDGEDMKKKIEAGKVELEVILPGNSGLLSADVQATAPTPVPDTVLPPTDGALADEAPADEAPADEAPADGTAPTPATTSPERSQQGSVDDDNLSGPEIAGLTVGALLLVGLIAALCFCFFRKSKEPPRPVYGTNEPVSDNIGSF